MRDTEAVASIVAGAPDGLPVAYDRYADPLFRYCRTLLGERAAAADAVQDTFVIAAARAGRLRAPGQLRSWLFAVARGECLRRLAAGNGTPASDTGPDEAPGVTGAPGDQPGPAEPAQLRPLFEAAVVGLEPAEHEVVELQLRQGLTGAEIAAVLGVSRSHASALLERAAEQLEACLGVLLVSRTGQADCAELSALLAGWDGQLTIPLRRRVQRHIEHCPECSAKRAVALRPAMLLELTPGAALAAGAAESFRLAAAAPPGLREHTIALAAGDGPSAAAHSAAVLGRAGVFGRHGFPRPAGAGRPALSALPRVETGAGGKRPWGTGAGGKGARGRRAGGVGAAGAGLALRSASQGQLAVAAAVVAAVVIAVVAFAATDGPAHLTPAAEAGTSTSAAALTTHAAQPSASPATTASRASHASPAAPKPTLKRAVSARPTPTQAAPPTQAPTQALAPVATEPDQTGPAQTTPGPVSGTAEPTKRPAPTASPPTASPPPAGTPTTRPSPPPAPSPSAPSGLLSVFPGGGAILVFPGGAGSPVFLHAFGGPVSWSVSIANDPGNAVSVSPGSGTLTQQNPGATLSVSLSQRLACGGWRHKSTPCPTITIWPSGTVLTVQSGF